MKVIASDTHRRHDPPHQFNVTAMGPYSESPDRIDRILESIAPDHEVLPPDPFDRDLLTRVHSDDYLAFLESVYPSWEARGGSPDGLIPFTYATGPTDHVPTDPVYAAGHYCFDAQTPIVEGTHEAAIASASCALTAAEHVRSGDRYAYALCRPPGHHAGRSLYGGYCFLNNAALAATQLAGRVAILDIDYHHGNGTQSIFYDRDDVLFVSIHASPNRAYPYFTGSASEVGAGRGAGRGAGHNRNYPLPPDVGDDGYLDVLTSAKQFIRSFAPDALVLSLGLDIYEHDPLGDFTVSLDGLARIGASIADLDLPIVIVQEGGYNTDLGPCVSHFLSGLQS